MRRGGWVVLLVGFSFAAAAMAASGIGLPYNLTFSPRPAPAASRGLVVGTFGGVPVTGTYAGTSVSGTLTLYVDQAIFVEGAYACSASRCLLRGTVAGRRAVEMLIAPELSAMGKASSAAFASRGDWIAGVREWAGAHLGSDRVQPIVDHASTAQISQADPTDSPGHVPNGGSEGGGM